MEKSVPRYFNTVDAKPENGSIKTPEVIKFDATNIKEKPWGRRREDRSKKKSFKKQNKPFIRNLNGKDGILDDGKVRRKSKPSQEGVKLPEELLKKYSTGEGVNLRKVRTKIHQKKVEHKERNIEFATKSSAYGEFVLTEDQGFLEADEGELTTQFTQKQIAQSADVSAAAKSFELRLEFGPYRSKYTRNGRHLILGGKKGHVAAFDWVTKELHCELNVMESVHDVSFLHIENMFAVAQKTWVHIYDKQGIEIHCVKHLHKISRLEFLQHHFLLVGGSEEGYLGFLDVSIGKMVAQFNTNLGPLRIMSQNRWNGCMCLGDPKGVVSIWSPNSRTPLAKMLCHKAPLTAVDVDPSGLYMATAATNREVKIWDIRKLDGPLQDYKMISAQTNLAFSQKNMLAVGVGNVVEIYRDCCTQTAKRRYLQHKFNNSIENFNFCPYEDVLGVSTAWGFTSLLVPGSGEPNFDTYEVNPLASKKQRQEAEVKALLDKIQPEFITLDPLSVVSVDLPTRQDKIEQKKKLLFAKPPKITTTKLRGSSLQVAKTKKILQEQARKEFKKNMQETIVEDNDSENKTKKKKKKKQQQKQAYSVLDRFVPKKK